VSEPPHSEDVARRDFPLSFRGFDQHEVRAYLGQLAAEIARWRERDEALQARIAELESAPPAPFDEAAIEAALGHEATRIIHAAREAAAEIRAKAEAEAAAKIAEADTVLAKAMLEAESSTAAIRAEVDEALAALREDTERRATAILEESRSKAAALVVDANQQREQILVQLTDLSAARDRLVASFDGVRRALDSAVGEVVAADDVARALLSEAAAPAPAVAEAPEVEVAVVEEVVADVEDVGDVVDAAEVEVTPEPEPEPEPAEDRRSSSLRLVRPAGGTPVAPPVDDEVEGVRLLTPEPEPEPEAEATLEPEPEPEPVAATPAPEPEPEPAVEDLFARLRADRAEKVATAQAVLSAEAEPATVEVEVAVAGAIEDDELEPDLALLAARDDALSDTERGLVRSLKRALADEQNEVLDALRRLKGRPTIDALLPDVAVHDARYEAVLSSAATSSAAAGGDAQSGAAVASELGRVLAADLRARIDRAVEDAGGDVDTLAEAISAAYREWKTARVEPLARDVVTAGYAAGTYASSTGDLRWVVDPAEGGCPDCDDNVLAGHTSKGTAFPTGQLHPPAHAGCRCLAVPVDATTA